MRLAAFNVENLFQRVKAFNDADPETHRDILDAHSELNKLFEKPVYTAADKTRILALMDTLGILNRDEGRFVQLRKIRGRLITRPRSGPPRIDADGRDDWVGWLELKTGPVDETAFQNTARVIAEANVDVLALVEVESRPVMLEFHDYIYQPVTADQYGPMMLIDGNDARGIDVGLMLRPGYRVASMLSHVDDRMPDGQAIFSRDCPEYTVELPNGARIVVLPNHFKSKYGGNDPRSRAKRRAQAEAVAGYYRRLRLMGQRFVAILGDLNDTPDSEELAPLFATDLREVSDHPAFTAFQFDSSRGGRGIGTFQTGSDNHKIDYIFLSPALWDRVTLGGMVRKGAWTASGRWDMFDTLTKPHHAASDHHLIWVDIDL